MSQQARRSNPYPWTWEPAAAVVAVLALAGLLGLQLGRSVANGLATGRWRMATPDRWVPSAWGVLGGDASAGLEPPPILVAAPHVLWTTCVLVEVVALVAVGCGLRWAWRRWSPFRPRGFADPTDLDRVLGLRRLRGSAPLIRPDLHDHGGRRS